MDVRLKERVVGAAVLAVLAIVFVPMLLEPSRETVPTGVLETNGAKDTQPTVRDNFSSRIKPLASSDTRPDDSVGDRTSDQRGRVLVPAHEAKVFPLADAPSVNAPQRRAQQNSEGTAASAREQPKATSVAAKATPKAVPKLEPKPEPSPKKALAGDWVVQLASFSKPDNASGLRNRLKGLGFNAFVVQVRTDGVAVSRVYVGPEKDKAAARRLIEPLRRAVDLKGLAVKLPAG